MPTKLATVSLTGSLNTSSPRAAGAKHREHLAPLDCQCRNNQQCTPGYLDL
jgi:hypothetical protein